MTLLVLSPLLSLIAGAILIWALDRRVRTWTQGGLALGTILVALALLAAQRYAGATSWAFNWGVIDGLPISLVLDSAGPGGLIAPLLLVCGAATAAGVMWTLGRATQALGLSFAGLLTLLAGGSIAAWSAPGIGSVLGLGVAWLGATILQQPATAHTGRTTFGGLALLIVASGLLLGATVPQINGDPLVSSWWLAGCALLIVFGPRWAVTHGAPLLVRAPAIALGLPLLGALLLTQHALLSAAGWGPRLTLIVLLAGMAGLIGGAIHALAARTLSQAFAGQLVAQFALIAITWGTGRPEAPPMATGLLAHALVTATAIALAIGQLERATRHESFATMPPLPQPLRRAGLAYGLAAISCAGLPPLLGYALRRVVVILAAIEQPWLTPVLLAASTLLALSFAPTLAVFFRRPVFRSPIARVEQRGGGWPLLLMIALLLAGLIPDLIWQWLLGDPATPQPQLPPSGVWVSTGITALLTLIVFGLINRALRQSPATLAFTGGEPLDEEPGWALPFAGLRAFWRPLLVPDSLEGGMSRALNALRERLSGPLRVLERQYYLVVIIVSLISVLLLAAQ